jgi:hypothetical protein
MDIVLRIGNNLRPLFAGGKPNRRGNRSLKAVAG